MAELHVQAPNIDLARTLMLRLHGLPSQVHEGDGGCTVSVSLAGNLDRSMEEALNAIDSWLLDHELSTVRVELDGHVYRLSPPSGASGRKGTRPADRGRANGNDSGNRAAAETHGVAVAASTDSIQC